MRNDENIFAKNLSELMSKAKYTLKDVEKGTSIPKTTLQHWRDGAKPRLEKRLLILAKFFGVTLENLLFNDINNSKRILSRIDKNTINGKLIDLDEKIDNANKKPVLSLPSKSFDSSEFSDSGASESA